MTRAEGGRFGFWTFVIGQVLTIASTVIGVYLAGYVGFQRTLEYDRLTKAQSQIRLVEAMTAEVEDNVTRLSDLAERMDPSGATAIYENGWPRLRLYVWDAAPESPALFELPATALTGVQGFYDDMARLLADERMREMFRRQTSSGAYERNQIKEALLAQLAEMRDQVLPSLRNAAEAPRRLLASYRDRYPELAAEGERGVEG